MQIKKYIPNTITCLNLFAGSIASVSALQGDLKTACWLILLAAVFDFMDGFAARGLGAYSLIGKELDSLADVVSFGFAPSCLVFTILEDKLNVSPGSGSQSWIGYIAFVIVVFSALRLAKFNVDERQTTSFLGLPTPANALFWVGIAANYVSDQRIDIPFSVLAALVLGFSIILVVDLPMFSLKIKGVAFRQIYKQLFLLLAGLLLFLQFELFGLSLTILLYVFSSFVLNFLKID